MKKKEIIVLSVEDFLKTIYFDNLKIENPYIVISIRDDDRILPIEIKKTDLCKDVLISEFIDLPESRVLELKEELNNLLLAQKYKITPAMIMGKHSHCPMDKPRASKPNC